MRLFWPLPPVSDEYPRASFKNDLTLLDHPSLGVLGGSSESNRFLLNLPLILSLFFFCFLSVPACRLTGFFPQTQDQILPSPQSTLGNGPLYPLALNAFWRQLERAAISNRVQSFCICSALQRGSSGLYSDSFLAPTDPHRKRTSAACCLWDLGGCSSQWTSDTCPAIGGCFGGLERSRQRASICSPCFSARPAQRMNNSDMISV